MEEEAKGDGARVMGGLEDRGPGPLGGADWEVRGLLLRLWLDLLLSQPVGRVVEAAGVGREGEGEGEGLGRLGAEGGAEEDRARPRLRGLSLQQPTHDMSPANRKEVVMCCSVCVWTKGTHMGGWVQGRRRIQYHQNGH